MAPCEPFFIWLFPSCFCVYLVHTHGNFSITISLILFQFNTFMCDSLEVIWINVHVIHFEFFKFLKKRRRKKYLSALHALFNLNANHAHAMLLGSIDFVASERRKFDRRRERKKWVREAKMKWEWKRLGVDVHTGIRIIIKSDEKALVQQTKVNSCVNRRKLRAKRLVILLLNRLMFGVFILIRLFSLTHIQMTF